MTPLDLAAQTHVKNMFEGVGYRRYEHALAKGRMTLLEQNLSWYWPEDRGPDIPRDSWETWNICCSTVSKSKANKSFSRRLVTAEELKEYSAQ